MSDGVTQELASFASAPLPALPAEVAAMGKRMISNAVALAVGSAFAPPVELAWSYARSLRTPPQATVLGRGTKVAAPWAALLNGMAVHVEDFDDTHLRTVLHPGAPIVPAALAVAERDGASGRTVLEAVVVAAEIAMRIGNGLCPSHFDRGWHVTGTMGHLGAALAAGRVAGLDATRMRDALGIGALEAAGLTSANGTMTKSFHPGKAAFDGVEASTLAALGLDAPPRALEGRRGLGVLMSEAPRYDEMLDGLGTRWEILADEFKPYACGVVSHAIIDATIELRRHFPDAEAIAAIDVRVAPVVLEVMGKLQPRDGLESKFSANHCAAIGFLDGAAGPRQFSDERTRAPEVDTLRRRITVTTTSEVPKGAASVEATGRDGRVVRVEIEHATGSVQKPMTAAQLEAKARLVAGDRIARALALIERLEELPAIGDLVAALPK